MSPSADVKSFNPSATSPGNISEDERQEMLSACERLRASLENPLERVLRLSFSVSELIALRVGVDMKLFDAAAKAASKGQEVRIEELSSEVNADPLLVTRFMRLLVGMGLFKELGEGVYSSTNLAGAYVSGSIGAAGVIHMSQLVRPLSGVPDYLEEKGYKNPDDAYDSPFQYALGTKLHCFDWLAKKPKLQQAFNTTMKTSMALRGLQWFDYFPVEEKLHVESSSAPLLVDVGGNIGHDLASFKQKYPNIPGKLILQDLSVVIDNTNDLPSGIEAMKYNFFDPQPVKGAKAYYLRSVLHDWPDKQSRQILGNIRDAMSPDSLLLICETIQPETNMTVDSAQIDLMMMTNYSSMERTRKQFETLLNDVGFELVNVWRSGSSTSHSKQLFEQSGLIEARLKKQ